MSAYKNLNKGDLSCEKRVYSHCWKLMTLNQVSMLNLPGEDVRVHFTLTLTSPTNPVLLQVVLELCRSKQVTDRETVDMHLERIRNLVSTWAAQVSCPETCLAVLSHSFFFYGLVSFPSATSASYFHFSPVSPRSSFQNPPLWIRLSCC